MSDSVNRFLGDSPLRTAIKLIVLSILIGFLMAIFHLNVWDLVDSLRDFILDLWHRGFSALGRIGDYLLLGGSVVLPVFLLIRLLNLRR